MGRQVKTGLDYFPFETKFFTDIKVRKLIKYQGGRSALIYACLLCSIYENGYYMLWDNEIPFLVSEKTGFEEGYINEVIKCCFNVGLFDKNLYEKSNVITSKGIQERYDAISKLLKRKHQITEFSLISSEEKGIYPEEITINPEETHINSGLSAQKKRKESKVKEIKINTPIIPQGENDENLFPEEEKLIDLVNPDAEKRKKVAPKKEKAQPPDLDAFVQFAKGIYQNELKLDFSLYEFAVRAKYQSWIDAGWIDGHKKPIENWKNKLRTLIPYFKPIYGKANNNSSNGSGTGGNNGGKVDGTKEILTGVRYFEPS